MLPDQNVKPRIIAEKYMQDGKNSVLPVYKVFLSGEPKIIQVIQDDEQKTESIDYFVPELNLFNLKQFSPNSVVSLKKPETFNTMLMLAKSLSKERDSFLRVDFYEVNGFF